MTIAEKNSLVLYTERARSCPRAFYKYYCCHELKLILGLLPRHIVYSEVSSRGSRGGARDAVFGQNDQIVVWLHPGNPGLATGIRFIL